MVYSFKVIGFKKLQANFASRALIKKIIYEKYKVNMEGLKNLLQNVALIHKKYEDLAEYSGENFNVFDVLGVRSSELSHSAILTNFLNANGKHGQKDAFLQLFLKQIKTMIEQSKFNNFLDSFVSTNSIARKEIFLGQVNIETAEGGRADIVITSRDMNIIIENKIYAGDQLQQLVRYGNYYKNAPIIYLTLMGNEPSPDSKGHLVAGVDFICISYKNEIKNWLQDCIKEMANKPFIRETLNQYLILINDLTNQSNNNKMSEEITSTILANKQNFNSFKDIYNAYNHVCKTIIKNDFIDKMHLFSIENNLEFIIDNQFIHGVKYSSFTINSDKLKSENICINFYFEGANFGSGLLGFARRDKAIISPPNYENILKKFQNLFDNVTTSKGNYICYTWFKELNNLNTLNNLENLKYGNLFENFTNIIKKLLEIV